VDRRRCALPVAAARLLRRRHLARARRLQRRRRCGAAVRRRPALPGDADLCPADPGPVPEPDQRREHHVTQTLLPAMPQTAPPANGAPPGGSSPPDADFAPALAAAQQGPPGHDATPTTRTADAEGDKAGSDSSAPPTKKKQDAATDGGATGSAD